MSMTLREALEALRALRRNDDVVITTMAAAREWMAMGSHPLDLVFVPSSMGQATSVGLGLALAQPQRRVIVVNGDGSMLMNLGSLASIAAAAPANLVVFVIANGVYEVTGAQPVPAAVDFEGVALACGIRSAFRFSNAEHFTMMLERILSASGPTVVALDVAAEPGAGGPRSPGPAGERAQAFKLALEARRI